MNRTRTLCLVIAAMLSVTLGGCGREVEAEPEGKSPPARDGLVTSEVPPAEDPDAAAPSATSSPEGVDESLLSRARKPFFGDFDELRERGFVRVLVSYSKTNFFYDGGRPRGFEVEMMQAWEDQLNEGAQILDRVKLVFIPTPFERLLEDLVEGRGDVIAAGMTVTPERANRVAFTDPYIGQVNEVVVANREAGEPASVGDLGGRRVVVRRGSSYVDHLRLAKTDRPIEIVEADERLVTEDLLEMVNSGAIELTVADGHLAHGWAEVLPDIVVRDDLAIHSGGGIAWSVRQGNPRLLAELNAFVAGHKKGSLLGNMLLKRYFANSKWIANPLENAERAKLEEQIPLFQKYADQFGFDWLALAAQAYQESGLDQSRRSAAGAVGVMQLLPSTAADKSVQVADIDRLENNIHAGAKYMAFLRDRYFDDPAIEPAARVDFAWAAYNAGPARVRGLRRKAEERGLDPNKWFANVEEVAAEQIGRETVDYVANINKYYLAYRLQYDAQRQRLEAVARAADS